MITTSQKPIYEAALTMGRTFFAQENGGLKIKPRLYPLIVGPTGVGKSHLVRQLAKEFNCPFLRITFGDWIPRGASDASGPTTYAILNAMRDIETEDPKLRLRNKARTLILHIDELDKFGTDSTGNTWTRSIGSDIWNTLDGLLPVQDWLAREGEPKKNEIEFWQSAIRKKLWIIGSGTWQDVFTEEDTTHIGFTGAAPTRKRNRDLAKKIRTSKMIPEELLARFFSRLLILRYPDTEEEIKQILDDTGITELANELGITLDPKNITLKDCGMREIQTIATRLLIEKTQRKLAITAATK